MRAFECPPSGMGRLAVEGFRGSGGGFEGDFVAEGLQFADGDAHLAVEGETGSRSSRVRRRGIGRCNH